MKKNNKKKLLIIFLFLFALVGVVGYGVYSYYFTKGEVQSNSDSIEVLAFDPRINTTSGDSFLGSGGSVELDCPDSTRGGETLTCTGTLTVTNNGGTDIYLSLDDISTDVSTNGYIEASAGDASFEWEDDTLAPGESTTLTISVPVTAGNSGGASSDPVEVYDTVQGGSVSVIANFKIIATQSR